MKRCRSRKCSNPASASTSPPVTSTPEIGDDRKPSRGCSRCCRLDLQPQVRRRVEDEPVSLIGRNGDRRLRCARSRPIARARAAAGGRVRIPLRKTSAGGGAEDYRVEHRIASPDRAGVQLTGAYLTSAQA